MMQNPSKIKEIIADSASEEQKEATFPQTAENTSRMVAAELQKISGDQDEYLQEQIEDLKHYRELRNKYARCVFIFMCVWALIMFSILIIKGFWGQCFTLSDTILTTLVGGTTVSVIGLVGFMMQGLFHSNGSNRKQKQYIIKV